MKIFDGVPPVQLTSYREDNCPSLEYLNKRRPRILENSQYHSVLNQASIEALHTTKNALSDESISHKFMSDSEAMLLITPEQPTLSQSAGSKFNHAATKTLTKTKPNFTPSEKIATSRLIDYIRHPLNTCTGKARSHTFKIIKKLDNEPIPSSSKPAHDMRSFDKDYFTCTPSRLINFAAPGVSPRCTDIHENSDYKQPKGLKSKPKISIEERIANNIDNLAIKYGGEVRLKFSQAEYYFRIQITNNELTESGVCLPLSMNWIVAHSKGQCLTNKIYLNGNRERIDPETIAILSLPYERQIFPNLAADFYHTPLKEEQILMTPPTCSPEFLENNELLRIKYDLKGCAPSGLASSDFIDSELMTEEPEYAPASLLAAILDNPLQTESIYKSILLTGPDSSHVLASHLSDAGEVTFFDPDFGELWFSDCARFADWFLQAYMAEITLRSRFHVLAYVYSPRAERATETPALTI